MGELLSNRNLQNAKDECDTNFNKCDDSQCCAQKTSVNLKENKKFSNKICIDPTFHNQTITSPDGQTKHDFKCQEIIPHQALQRMASYQQPCNKSSDCNDTCNLFCLKVSIQLSSDKSVLTNFSSFQQVNSYCVSDYFKSFNPFNYNYTPMYNYNTPSDYSESSLFVSNLSSFQDQPNSVSNMYQTRVYYNKTDTSSLACGWDDYYPYDYDGTLLQVIIGFSVGIPLGIIAFCYCICCVSNCIGIMCYGLISPGKFDQYHISNEINMNRIMTSKTNKVTPEQTPEYEYQPQNMLSPEPQVVADPTKTPDQKFNDMF